MSSEPIVIHLPQHAKDTPLGREQLRFFGRLAEAFSNLNIDFDVVNRKDKSLRRDPRFRHILYHTRRRSPNVLNVKVGYLPGYFYLDPTGYSGWASFATTRFRPQSIDTASALSFHRDLKVRFIDTRISKYRIPETAQTLPEAFIAIFLQVQNDEVLELAHTSAREMVEATLQSAGDMPVVIKPHPLCDHPHTRSICAEFDARPNVHIASGNVHHVLAGANQVVTVNSGAGFEALLYCKPVTLFGRSDYWQAARTWRNGRDVFEEAARTPRHIKKFLYWYLTQQMHDVDADDFDERLHRKLRSVGWL